MALNDKWTCPHCGKVFVFFSNEVDFQAKIKRIDWMIETAQHLTDHMKEAAYELEGLWKT